MYKKLKILFFSGILCTSISALNSCGGNKKSDYENVTELKTKKASKLKELKDLKDGGMEGSTEANKLKLEVEELTTKIKNLEKNLNNK